MQGAIESQAHAGCQVLAERVEQARAVMSWRQFCDFRVAIHRLVGLVVKSSDSRAADPRSNPALPVGLFPGRVAATASLA